MTLPPDSHDQPGLEDVLDRLMSEVHRRCRDLPAGSYTTSLIQGGIPKMGAKVLEEAAEVVEAAQSLRAEFPRESSDNPSPERQHLIYEACDVLYHLWVLLGSFGIEVDELRAELARREGTSGLEEKRQRQKNDN